MWYRLTRSGALPNRALVIVNADHVLFMTSLHVGTCLTLSGGEEVVVDELVDDILGGRHAA